MSAHARKDRSGLIVSETWRLVYCIVPKAACSNWIMLLRRLEGFADYALPSSLHDREASGLTYMTHDEANRSLDLDRYFKFTFVRNPFTRLLSAWRNKFDPTAGRVHETWLAYAREVRDRLPSVEDDAGGPLSFRDFVRFLGTQPEVDIPNHWAPQTRILATDHFEYDFVGRIENLAADFETVRRRVGFRAPFPTRDDLWFHPPTGAKTLAPRMYTPELTRVVSRVYADDFEAFGYDAHTVPGAGAAEPIPAKEHANV